MLTIITPVLKITEDLISTANSINDILVDHEINWWIVSPKKTKKDLLRLSYLQNKRVRIFVERGPQIWAAYNTIINKVDDFYIPLSAGDILIKDQFSEVLKIINNKKNNELDLLFFFSY